MFLFFIIKRHSETIWLFPKKVSLLSCNKMPQLLLHRKHDRMYIYADGCVINPPVILKIKSLICFLSLRHFSEKCSFTGRGREHQSLMDLLCRLESCLDSGSETDSRVVFTLLCSLLIRSHHKRRCHTRARARLSHEGCGLSQRDTVKERAV